MNQMNPAFVMPDVQSTPDTRQIPIQRVGVKAVRHPLTVRTQSGDAQPTVGTWNLDVHLPADQKGTHMSRFVALLEENKAPLEPATFRTMLAAMLQKLEAEAGRIEVSFPYFVNKTAPVSGVQSLLDYEVTLTGETRNGETRLFLKVLVPVTSLCPCSKKISQYGAHNQRSHVTINAELAGEVAVEDLIRIAEEEASCELWGLLKRPDEKFVTERAYENPKFVEDLVRDVAQRLNADERIVAYVLEAENFESIHNHSAYAVIERDKRVV
ncbi:GTP cyclohydrolase I [Paraburkholderia sp. GV068]|jgi:GTP cyclohydrolase I|uniref:GTP cyclohydrolase FolE2 n=1 Tax=Paraburkholderia TaxID=1822464 RepID=UPI0006B3F580|nr:MULTISPECIES: GTP cyclohydrolase FolE2 [Paraburkholderia]ALE57777.1 GTP cyclohydrolase [Burkholderia sp. HB1]AXF12227.1 GTP cyclohydrolase I FolE2 [Paraburkholderia graminis]MDR6472125.1 GTP cyclohydrolase I [Paraburkholderia graminis]MDR6478657.1 GTP cyclohydrolase I [Paraburkholderia graminis]PTQ93519.1 GTP cyclohydrolase I [Paraburkholderia sp. GV072]